MCHFSKDSTISPNRPKPSTPSGVPLAKGAFKLPTTSQKMHFAYPPRKTSYPPPYAVRNSRSLSLSYTRRRQLQAGAIILFTAVLLIFGMSHLFSSSPEERIPLGTPEIVVVTLMDEESLGRSYMDKIQENRRDYAARHGTIPQ